MSDGLNIGERIEFCGLMWGKATPLMNNVWSSLEPVLKQIEEVHGYATFMVTFGSDEEFPKESMKVLEREERSFVIGNIDSRASKCSDVEMKILKLVQEVASEIRRVHHVQMLVFVSGSKKIDFLTSRA